MTLLRLSPDSERLRRIAKAHAAGELSTPDYRRIRAEVIERFSSGEVQEFDDDTQPRWHNRPIPTPQPVPVATDASAATQRRFWWWALVVSVIVLAAVGSAAAWSSSIPPVKQRDPNPATSPRVPVDHLGVVADLVAGSCERVVKDPELDPVAFTENRAVHRGGIRAASAQRPGLGLSPNS